MQKKRKRKVRIRTCVHKQLHSTGGTWEMYILREKYNFTVAMCCYSFLNLEIIILPDLVLNKNKSNWT